MKRHSVVDGEQLYVYGDDAFIMRPWIQITFNRTVVTIQQIEFSKSMSGAREAVKWSYKDIKKQFTAVDFARMLKVCKAPTELMYKMIVFLWNLKVYLNGGGQVGSYFKCDPPSLEEYLFSMNDD